MFSKYNRRSKKHVFNMIWGKNVSKNLTKDILWECKCKFDGKNVIQIKSGIKIHVDASAKKIIHVKKIIFEFLLHVVAKMRNI